MYDDERRKPELRRKMLLDDFAANSEEMYPKYLALMESNRRAQVREARESWLEKLVVQHEEEKEELTRELGKVRSALDAYRKESRRLKDDLRRVRGSRSIRIGRAITRAFSVFRPGAGRHRPDADPALPGSSAELASGALPTADFSSPLASSGASISAGATASDVQSGRSTATDQPPRKLWELTYEELAERLEAEPRGDALSALLSRTWFQRGDIITCERLLENHSNLAEGLPPKGRELVARIRGAARLRRAQELVPPRAHEAAYRVEPGRVMYCVHSTPVYDSNGYSTRTRGLVEGLHDNSVDVCVVSRIGYPWDIHPESAPQAHEREIREVGGVEYVHLPGADLNRDPLDQYVLKAADAYVREAKIRRPQRIHAASNFRQALPALIAARRLGVPFIYEVRGLWELTEAASKDGWEDTERFALHVQLENLVATEADHVLAITGQVRDELIKRGVASARITLAPNAVNPDEFVPLPKDLEYARNLGITLDRPVIGFAGSIVAYEGLDILLEAVRMIRDRDIPLQVIIAGSGAAEAELRGLSAQLRLEDDVTFLGRLPSADIPRLMSIMDVMPCPRLSTRVTELVSPLKPLESLAAGKAVVLSAVSPQVDLAPPGSGRGLLAPAGDAEALADVLAEVLLSPDLARSMARAGRLWVVRERTWNAVSSAVRSAYAGADRYRQDALAEVPRLPLEQIRLGIVADEFTTETLGHRVELVPISRRDPLAALEQKLDAVFVESAWEGNGGEWFHGVGYYDSEQFAALDLLLRSTAAAGIPSIFWNKEDPVHYRRFIQAAVHFDHVFSTDASLLGDYFAAGAPKVCTVSALPFYAEQTLHNPVQSPVGLGTSTAMYAGTYYGQRYAARSKELAAMLKAAEPYGLTIYDRQHGKSDTPYRFPKEFASQISGSLPYNEVLDAYRRHAVSLNVNSVTDSPSMFSRRVVEAAASGGVVLSGPGRGVVETFGGAIPASSDPDFQRALLRAWKADPTARFDEAWFQLRAVARSHTTETALAIMLRTAGIAVDGPRDPRYVALLSGDSAATPTAVLAQSVPAAALAVPDEDVASVQVLTDLPVITLGEAASWAREEGVEALVDFKKEPSRTFAEDLFIAHRFRGDTSITAREFASGDDSRLLAAPASVFPIAEGHRVVGTFTLLGGEGDASDIAGERVGARDSGEVGDGAVGLTIVVPRTSSVSGEVSVTVPTAVKEQALVSTVPDSHNVPSVSATETPSVQAPTLDADPKDSGRTVLIAGHDLKFLAPYVADLEAQGHTVLIDHWAGHSAHDEEKSQSLLGQADVVWCEWGLGNAVWYSHHVASNQRLVVRVHLQEIDLPYLRMVRMDAVDSFVFVGELIRRAAVEGHGVPAACTVVVPNMVRTASLARPKTETTERTLGLVGIVPQRKRLDLAVDLVEQLREVDPRFRLRIKGKRPEEYPWMEERPEEMSYYREQYQRIKRLNSAAGEEVIGFDPHGSEMGEWYQGIDVVVSVSDFESFHLTLADGAASGADAVSLAWDGADLIYPDSMLFPDVSSMVTGLLDEEERQRRKADLAPVIASFDERLVYDRFTELLFARGARPTVAAESMKTRSAREP
ncbi:glycosyltransferase [Brevibacterium aurantiacum]|uniref:D-inositol 3-phosphate glycosyltransferase n=1 Tax=Brevibacterium aurantiacum TaxID=273384 RepID=A0A2A3YQF8_BREAU|nr:glycosyltransferase [Brevibacterium aurantiacum]PCC41528.1 hypothetical protein CIK65_16610 [Brevibacterium aurantiacum]